MIVAGRRIPTKWMFLPSARWTSATRPSGDVNLAGRLELIRSAGTTAITGGGDRPPILTLRSRSRRTVSSSESMTNAPASPISAPASAAKATVSAPASASSMTTSMPAVPAANTVATRIIHQRPSATTAGLRNFIVGAPYEGSHDIARSCGGLMGPARAAAHAEPTCFEGPTAPRSAPVGSTPISSSASSGAEVDPMGRVAPARLRATRRQGRRQAARRGQGLRRPGRRCDGVPMTRHLVGVIE